MAQTHATVLEQVDDRPTPAGFVYSERGYPAMRRRGVEPYSPELQEGRYLGMKGLTVEEPENLFTAPSDAVLYLIGLGGFWGGVAGALVAADLGAPSFVSVAFLVIAIGSWFPLMTAIRKLEHRMTGRSVRPWPFGYTSFRTQLIAALPSTVTAAAQRLKLNAIIVTVAMYSFLAIGLVALVALPTTR